MVVLFKKSICSIEMAKGQFNHEKINEPTVTARDKSGSVIAIEPALTKDLGML